jgi:hypothetical protein
MQSKALLAIGLLATGFVMFGGAAMADPVIPVGDEVQYTFTRLTQTNSVTFVYDSPVFIDVMQNGPGFIFTPTSCSGCADFTSGNVQFVESNGSFDDVIAGGAATLFLGNDAFTSLGVHNALAPSGPTLDVELVSAVASVPELSTWAMMLLGFLGLGFMAYRRKQIGEALSVA